MKPNILRLNSELKMLEDCPAPGISCYCTDDCITKLEAIVAGPEESPYSGVNFQLSLDIPDRYPFEPPQIRFRTPIYHPNIDSDGRICLDTLKMPPQVYSYFFFCNHLLRKIVLGNVVT